ncbi:MAG TPA: hypothetical protein VIJ46_04185 [Rhabdochlamydiaceae bacterium]
MKYTGGSNMNNHNADSRQIEKLRKSYHAPELTTLGPIQSVIRNGHAGPGGDAGTFPTSSAS